MVDLRRADNLGGAILAAGDSNLSTAGLLENNVAGGNGGGLAVLGSATVAVCDGAAFVNNSAGGAGGCAFFGGGPVTFGECSFQPSAVAASS